LGGTRPGSESGCFKNATQTSNAVDLFCRFPLPDKKFHGKKIQKKFPQKIQKFSVKLFFQIFFVPMACHSQFRVCLQKFSSLTQKPTYLKWILAI
jgi:hypothetical protein